MKKTIAILPGDGIGPEIMREAIKVLKVAVPNFDDQFDLAYGLIGGAAFDETGMHFPEATLKLAKRSEAILFGSVGGPVLEAHLPKWNGCETNSILAIRKAFNFYANLRPISVYPELMEISPLKADRISSGIDIVVVRELSGDVYFGKHEITKGPDGERKASDTAEYSEDQIKRIAKVAFDLARQRGKKVTSVDKANVLATSKLWREVVSEIGREYADVELEHMLVDNCAMQLVVRPSAFDVVLTANLFGDILSDLGAVLPGSLGLLGSASLNAEGFGLFEPPSGSAPDIAGKNIANPTGQILSAAMMLRLSLNMPKEAQAIEEAVKRVIRSGARTGDIYRDSINSRLLSTTTFGDAVVQELCN